MRSRRVLRMTRSSILSAWSCCVLLAGLLGGCGGGGGGGSGGDGPPAHAFVRVDPADRSRLIDGSGRPLVIRGIQLEGWLHMAPLIWGGGAFGGETQAMARFAELVGGDEARAFRRDVIASFITERDIERMARLGFNVVRLPINHLALDTYGDGWAAIDDCIAWCRTHGLFVMLDLHAAPGPQSTSASVADYSFPEPLLFDTNGRRSDTIAMWRALAQRYRSETTVLGYDLLNEPDSAAALMPAVGLPAMYAQLVAAIRAVDPHHLLIIEGDSFARDFSSITTRFDDNACLSFHTYNWFGEDLGAQIATYRAKAAALGMPIFNGEFGGNTDAWVAGTRRSFEAPASRVSGWVFWTWKSVRRTGGNWFGIPYEQIHYVRELPQDPGWRKVIDWVSGEAFAPRPTAAEARTAMAWFRQAILLASTTENEGIVEALFAPAPPATAN